MSIHDDDANNKDVNDGDGNVDDDGDDSDLLNSRLGLAKSPPVNWGRECSRHLRDNSV